MASRTILIESNNKSSKLYTNRQQIDAVVGAGNISTNNSKWSTDLKYGVSVSEGDEITVSGAQINLRGSPDASMEFSGGVNSDGLDENELADNITTIEYGYYFSNTKQYNLNLPLAEAYIAGGERWWQAEYGYPKCEQVRDFNINEDNEWYAFFSNYPIWAVDGCTKVVESQPPIVASSSTPVKQVNTIRRWNVLDTERKIGDLPPMLGSMLCGDHTSAAISNGPYSLAFPNEKRLYLLKDAQYIDTTPSNNVQARTERYLTSLSEILNTNKTALKTREGFQTPSSVAQDLTEQMHERDGTADNWADDFTDASIYLHDARYFLGDSVHYTDTEPFIPKGGYKWEASNTLTKYPVSQVSDKFMKIVRTSGGQLLDAIQDGINDEDSLWHNFVADIPGNAGWRGSGSGGDAQNVQGSWDKVNDTSASTYNPLAGRLLLYKNLLCGEIGRHLSLKTQIQMCAGNSFSIDDLAFYFKRNDPNLPNPNMIFENKILDKKVPNTDIFYNRLTYLNMGAKIPYPMPLCNWDPESTDGNVARQFGQDRIVNTDNWGFDQYGTDDDRYSPAFEQVTVGSVGQNNLSRVFTPHSHIIPNTVTTVIRKRRNMVFPTNIIATPRSIAEIKKMLWASRKAKNISSGSKGHANVRKDCKVDNINIDNVAELDLFFTDDGASVNVNARKAVNDPSLDTARFSVPPPYACANNVGLGAPTSFANKFAQGLSGYKRYNFDYQTPKSTFVYTVPGSDPPEASIVPRLSIPTKQNLRYNRNNFKVAWEDEFLINTTFEDHENHDSPGIYLNPKSIFKFTDDDGNVFKYPEYFKPQEPGSTLFLDEFGKRYDLWQEQDTEQDPGVALCVVYYKRTNDASSPAFDMDSYPDQLTGNPLVYPGGPTIEDKEAEARAFYNTPFLAFISNRAEETDNDTDIMHDYFLPMCIGENMGISPSFSDGEYAKIINTQRVNPKAYNTITQQLASTNSDYDSYISRHNPLYFNIYDYYPYVMIGAENPTISFGGTSGRFEISNFHTPLYVGNGPWADVSEEGATSAAQADESIASLNNKLAWTSMISYDTTLFGALIQNTTAVGGGRLDAPHYIDGVNHEPNQDVLKFDYTNSSPSFEYQMALNGLYVIPWGELYQDSNEHKVVTSQSGVGLIAMYVPNVNQDLVQYVEDISENRKTDLQDKRMSPWAPNSFKDTLFNKMGFEIEQLIPMVNNCQSNGFNRSNYNKYIGYDGQRLTKKQDNMLYPFTTNAYISGSINIQGQTRNWVGYDTIVELNRHNGNGHAPGWGYFPQNMATMRDYGDGRNTLKKILPAGDIFEMYSMGGLNFMTGTNVTVESDVLVASKQPRKFDFSYLVIYSDIIQQQSNFIGSNKILPLPAVGYMSRNYSSSDFFYSFANDFNYVVDRNHVINNFSVEIRYPNGKQAILEDNSSIIFKVIKKIPIPLQIKPPAAPSRKEISEEQKEKEKYYKSLIS